MKTYDQYENDTYAQPAEVEHHPEYQADSSINHSFEISLTEEESPRCHFVKNKWIWAATGAVFIALIAIALFFGLADDSPTTTTISEITTPTMTTATTPLTNTSMILVVWDFDNTKALLTNSNGVVADIRWGNEGLVSSASLCKVVFKNQFYILGQVLND